MTSLRVDVEWTSVDDVVLDPDVGCSACFQLDVGCESIPTELLFDPSCA
jgi:hypothetical protein